MALVVSRFSSDSFLSNNALNISNITTSDFISLLYQTGYLTLSSVNIEDDIYMLNYPNKEVAISFTKYLAQAYLGLDSEKDLNNYPQIVRALYSKDIESFIENINNFFTSLSYSNQKFQENTFQIGIVALLNGGPKSLDIRIEERSFKGRSDIVVITSKYIYIIELKLDTKASVGMDQMKDKKYYQPYLNNEDYKDKGIILISIAFDSKTKEVKDYLVETIR